MKALILAGGRGSRLWPISTKYKPKQFQRLINQNTMLQETVKRLEPLFSLKDIYISTNKEYLNEVAGELPNLPRKNIILEPLHRERLAGILLFFAYLDKKDLGEPILVLPSDHLIKDAGKFSEAIKAGENFVKNNPDRILLFGEKPTFPDTGLGYIKKGAILSGAGEAQFYKIPFFKEKPNLQRTREFLKSKEYFWNTGIYLFMPASLEQAVKDFVPENYARYQKIKAALSKKTSNEILEKEYGAMNQVSLEYSIIENYKKNAFLPVSIGWSDIGSWAVLKNCLATPNENFIKGNHVGVDSKDIMVYGREDKLVATVGIKNMIVAVTDDIVLVCHKKDSQRIKEVIKKLEQGNNIKYI